MKQTLCRIAVLFFSTTVIVYADSAKVDPVAAYTEETLSAVMLSSNDATKYIEDYLNSPAGAGMQGADTWIENSVAIVPVLSTHSDWAKHRALTYKVAWSNIQENFIQFQMSETRTEIVRKLYADASGNVDEYEPDSYTGSDAIDEFIDKSGAYISSKLNAALQDAGIDPEEYSRGNSKQRQKILEDSIRQETVVRAMGKVAGLWPLNTYVTAVDGRYAIGVIGIYKPAYEEFAIEISEGRIPQSDQRSDRPPLKDRIASDPATLANSFGVHPVRDERGYPALLSFGQWGVSGNHRNPTIAAKFNQVAIKQARSQADAEISIFLNGTANLVNKSYVGSLVEEYIDVGRDGYNEPGTSIEIEDILNQVLTTKGQVKLSGLTDLRTWTYRHPENGQTMVGVVRIWTVAQSAAADSIRSSMNQKQKTSEKPENVNSQPDKNPKRSFTESQDYTSPNDF
jgi:hypothetical protein